jgi:hypothetical protein
MPQREVKPYDSVKIAEGSAAQELLGNEVFRAALKSAQERIIDEWVDATDVVVREARHAEIKGLDRVVVELMTIVGDGKHAQHAKEREESTSN